MPEKLEDLDLEGLIRLFNKTLNKQSFERLRSIFYSFPLTIEEIHSRQQDLRLLLLKKELLQSYT